MEGQGKIFYMVDKKEDAQGKILPEKEERIVYDGQFKDGLKHG